MTLHVVLWCVAALLATSVVGLAFGRAAFGTRVVYLSSLAASLVAFATALAQLLGAPLAESTATIPVGLPWHGAHMRIDVLAAFFLAVVNLGGAAASLYGLGYGRHEQAPQRVLPFFPAFLAGMNLVLLAADSFSFLLAWEFMSLTSWALVMSHHRAEGNTHSGYVYLIMANIGTLALLLAFGLLAGSEGGYDFSLMRVAEQSPPVTSAVVLLVLFGAGSKAGIVPLHVWLPLAHPAAPSHVSALMSGVMTKVAVYAVLRVVFEIVREPPWWTGALVLLIGGVTAATGVIAALMQRDIKRLLAYSTIENIGMIFIGLGLALAFRTNGMSAAAALALTAALLHVFNHSLFKSLLFFGAGAVQNATNERDMEKLGGLIHRMPVTSVLVLIGCVAIAALPPLNGFVSEWLLFQTIVQSPEMPQWGLRIMIPAVGGLLALSVALAGACFVRLFGVTFLGRPRSQAAEQAHEVDRVSIWSMGILAGFCLLAGVVPGFVIDAIAPLTHSLVADHLAPQTNSPWLTLVPITESRSSYNGLVLLAYLAGSVALVAFLVRRFSLHAVRRGPAWDCGFPEGSPTTQYTGTSFAQPFRAVFGSAIFHESEKVFFPRPGDTLPARNIRTNEERAWTMFYAPVAKFVGDIADRLNHLQFLTIRRYLGLVFLALIILLLAIALWG